MYEQTKQHYGILTGTLIIMYEYILTGTLIQFTDFKSKLACIHQKLGVEYIQEW